MKIEDIISKHYPALRKMVKDSECHVYSGYTQEDIFHNCLITTINKYHNKDISEEDAINYMKVLIYREIRFGYKRRKGQRTIYVPDLIAYDKIDENSGE